METKNGLVGGRGAQPTTSVQGLGNNQTTRLECLEARRWHVWSLDVTTRQTVSAVGPGDLGGAMGMRMGWR